MLKLCSAMLYAALCLTANAALLPGMALADQAALEALRDGDMQKLVFSDAKPLPDAVLLDAEDAEQGLGDYDGKVVLLNFWATWCAPCRAEMPSLARVQTDLGGADFAVVPIATGRNSVAGIAAFFAEAGVSNLPTLRDPKQQFARDMGILGLPMSVIVNRKGEEVARLIGDADWSSPSAKAILSALIAAQ